MDVTNSSIARHFIQRSCGSSSGTKSSARWINNASALKTALLSALMIDESAQEIDARQDGWVGEQMIEPEGLQLSTLGPH